MTVDPGALLADLKKVVRHLEDDVRQASLADDAVAARLRQEHRDAVEKGRTATAFTAWVDTQVTQAAVAWVLATVFVRFCEDNRLVDEPWITGPGSRSRVAGERQRAFFLRNPLLNDRDWLLAAFEHLAGFPAVAPLFDPAHNPLHRLAVSGDGAEHLVSTWRRTDADGALVHDFTDPDLSTRFLGDLYQDLSEAARKQFALLQTPEFVEEFILDLTLDPAIDEFGLEGLKMIDPTCGSGHFLLGAFHRLLDRTTREAPGRDVRERVQSVLDSVHGVDVNPFAAAIAKFRLTIAALRASGVTTLASAPGYRLHVATGDSLLWEQGRQDELFDTGLADHQFQSEDLHEHPGILRPGTYHAVVGNPPYITVKDKALNEAYRKAYPTCSGTYALSVPFAELFFRLAVQGERAGFVGQITSNSFMKREFGKKLIEQYLRGRDLQHVIDTSGAYIPGHGTPTVIVVGRNRHPTRAKIRVALGVRGEPTAPTVPSQGHVWQSIVQNVGQPGFENDYVSIADIERDRLSSHPWSLAGGGAGSLQQRLEAGRATLRSRASLPIGRAVRIGADDAFERPHYLAGTSRALTRSVRAWVVGEGVRDWSQAGGEVVWFPYTGEESKADTAAALWRWRTTLAERRTFQGNMADAGLHWFEYMQRAPFTEHGDLSVVFAFVSTHNHFHLDRGGRVFKQSAVAIKLPEGTTEEEHLGLLGVLNSSTATFWCKQVCHDKGGGGIGGGLATEDWEHFYEYTGTKLQQFPLPTGLPSDLATRLDRLQQRRTEQEPWAVVFREVPTRSSLDDARAQHVAIRAEMVFWQEELDWQVYQSYGLVHEDLTYDGAPVELSLGERAFEVALARKVAAGEAETAWFERHGSTPITDLPDHWPADYRALVERRLALIASEPSLKLLERPECKRRWASESWESMESAALRDWLLDRLEDRGLWFDRNGRPRIRSVAQLADELAADADFASVLGMWAGRADVDPTTALGRLLSEEHVPHLAAFRYKESGLRARAAWEETWDLQRREDAGEAVGTIAVPPKYRPADFVKTSYWRHRGKLDVPKERFISYPGAERGADDTLVLGWAGWDHAEQALALAGYALERVRVDSWDAGRLVPLWAGVAELEPWVRQWHGEVDPRMGTSPADAVSATLEQELARLQVTRHDLAAWRPPVAPRGRARRTTNQQEA